MLRSRPLVALVALVTLAQTLAGCGAASSSSGGAAEPQTTAAAVDDSSYPRQYTATGEAAAPAADEAAPMVTGAAAPMAQQPVNPAPTMMVPAPPPPAPGTPKRAEASKSEAERKVAVVAPKPSPQQPAPIAVSPPEPKGTEDYKDYGVNPVVDPAKDRLSTFAIDVDTASYSIARRKIMEGTLPPFASIRAEEFLNYFDYSYEAPKSGPFAVHFAAAPSPFTKGHHLVRVAVQGKRVPESARKPVHLVYLVDTSGSMEAADKIPLAKRSLKLLTSSLKKGDTVALCTYAGNVREVLAPTGIEEKDKIFRAIDDLSASGSTAMASGIELAYKLAERTLVKGHVNRVIVLSDGDANVGPTSHEAILDMIGRYKEKGITLSTVGFGTGNYKDTMMERLADKGDGNYAYIDSEVQAKRVFQDQLSGMLEVIARDVKIQVEFDPKVVKEYRLIGYENRDIADKDFRNDKVDAGEIGNGHAVTAIYDVVLKDTKTSPIVLRLRHKQPLAGDTASESEFKMDPATIAASFDAAGRDFRFAATVAAFAEVLRQSPHARDWSMKDIARLADQAATTQSDQQEFVSLVHRAEKLATGNQGPAVAR
ncbi:von Willebrand factor type A domain-containing protein [Polyangium sp. 6x1]|uniref:vWA domain-containing protein n=1 Tax=Polyangium sp. 6x1 TaxID=3042689 RepID=UPI00248242EB|nr:von Willebrand factor type A domain-containing protein [Polyangium sp. 6x1]MDI1445153.1 von Willebrand factor type A domain-containing protein [Polyangium sp. 6x1]